MTELLLMGCLSALGAFILICKMNLPMFVEYYWQTDLVFTILMTWIFFGTFSGMVTAVVAGIVFSCLLYVAKLVVRQNPEDYINE